MLFLTSNRKDYSMSDDIRYQPVTVDVPADRVAEFHFMFGRFLAGVTQSERGPRGRHHRGHHGHGCAGRRATAPDERSEVTEA
jgi:hypothetical protein